MTGEGSSYLAAVCGLEGGSGENKGILHLTGHKSGESQVTLTLLTTDFELGLAI